METVTLLGVPLHALTAEQAQQQLRQYVAEPKAHHIMTPNAEMLVEATHNAPFHALLRRTALNLPDSSGLLWMARWTGQTLPQRVTGVDTVMQLCRTLPQEHSVFLLGAAPGVAEKAGIILRMSNPNLRIVGTYSGSPRSEDRADILKRIQEAKPHVLLVAFGAPAQDLWIDANLPQLPTVRLAMGVGGTFDFIAGAKKRAPKLFQQLSLEWLWRLFLEPRRWKRILTAVVVFPWLVMRYGKHSRVILNT
jgi:N-acetylglucosaminyldiphosphoundecaprenol N-acetyl-beta-D-mannosaminyltransferase